MKKKKTEFDPEKLRLVKDEYMKAMNKEKNGIVLDIFTLDGTFAMENAGELTAKLDPGDELSLTEESGNLLAMSGGDAVGLIPFRRALLPRLLMKKNQKVFCVVEYSGVENGLPAVYVSLRCGKY